MTTELRRTVAAIISSGLLAAAAAVPSIAAAPVKDPSAIDCPKPPAGWTNPANTGKTVQSPQINANIAALGASDQVEITCDYFLGSSKHILVSVSYAVPDDINPQSDFYWGCASGGTPWNRTDRVFRVMSSHQWAIAAFSDVGGSLVGAEVPKFEQVTEQLLHNAEGYGHVCALNTRPTLLTSNFHFSFQVAAGRGSGSFWAAVGDTKNTLVPVVRVIGVAITLHVKTTSGRYPLTIRVERGIDYLPARPHAPGRVRLGVRVVSSRVPLCDAGKTGTLTISTAPSVQLAVCGATFLQGRARTQIQFFY